jgi:hypothetical protein
MLQRFREPSTWLGILTGTIAVLLQFHLIELTPEQRDAIQELLIIVLGNGLVMTKDS